MPTHGPDGSAPTGDDEPRWLTSDEKDAWSALVAVMLLLPGRLESPLQTGANLTLFEYLVLSHISEAPQRRLRMSELAFLANGSLSRLSNVVKRFDQRGWVERSPDPSNGRFTIATLTRSGYRVVAAAAPLHLKTVRELVLDPLNDTDRRALVRIAAKLRIRPTEFG